MALKNARDANFLQIDKEIKKISFQKNSGFYISKIGDAYNEKKIIKKYFPKKPSQGYFLLVEKNPLNPIFACFSLVTKKSKQEPKNFIIVKDGVKAKMFSFCNAKTKKINGAHRGKTVILLGKRAELKVNVLHSWGSNDDVETKTDVVMAEGAKFIYSYNDFNSPKKLYLDNKLKLAKFAKADIRTGIYSSVGNVFINEEIKLQGDNSSGVSKLKVVADKKSSIKAISKIVAIGEKTNGRTECSGMIVGDKGQIDTIPELFNKSKTSTLSHEASVGRISEDVLNYLRSRGLNEDESISLVISGFLEEEKEYNYFQKLSNNL